jgi:hypothetical protein
MRSTTILAGLSLLLGTAALQSAEPIGVNAAVEVAPQPPDSRAQVGPDVAFDGDQTFLVVWQQGRKFFEGPDPQVLAARVSADGRLLDAKPIEICAAKGAQEAPRVVFSKGVFLVVWQDFRNGKDWDVYAARVTPDGKVLDREGLVVAASPYSQALPTVAVAPDGFLVAWQDFRNGRYYRPCVGLVSAEGRPAVPGGTELKSKGQELSGGSVGVVRAGDIWFLFWNDERAMGQGNWRFGRLDASLNVLDSAPFPCGLMGRAGGRFAGDGQKALYVCTFSAGHGGGCNPAAAALLDPAGPAALKNPNQERDGVGVGTSGFSAERMIVVRDTIAGARGIAAAGCDGRNYLVAYRGYARDRKLSVQSDQIFVARLTPDGRRIDDTVNQTVLHDGSVPGANPAVAGGKAGTFLVVYETDGGPGQHRVIARTVNAK